MIALAPAVMPGRRAPALLCHARRAVGFPAILALLACQALLSAPAALAQAQTLWSATLKVDYYHDSANKVHWRGCSGALHDPSDDCTDSGVLSDNDFIHDGKTYEFVTIQRRSIYRFQAGNQNLEPTLVITFRYISSSSPGVLPSDIRTRGKLHVTAGGTTTTLPVSDATFNWSQTIVRWANPGFSWTEGQTVSLSLTLDPLPVTAPTLTTIPLNTVSYGSDSRSRPAGSAAWRERFAFASSTALTGRLNANTANRCATGTTLETGWYRSDASTTRLGTVSSTGNAHDLSYTPTAAGEYRALAYCVRGAGTSKTWSTAVNLMRGGAVTVDGVAPAFKLAQVDGNELIIAFSETMDTAKPGKEAFNVQVGGTRRTVSSYSLSGDTARLTLSSPVELSQTVTVTYTKPGSSPVLQDRAGNALATFQAQTVFNLSIAPKVSTYSPADNAGGVAVDANLVLTFGEPMKKGTTGNIVIKPSGGTAITIPVTDAQVSIGSGANNNEITIDPTNDLTDDTAYAVRIDAGAFRDFKDNGYKGITNDTTWNFNTGQVGAGGNSDPADATAPDPVASVSVAHNESSLVVSWEAPARATHYDVTYYGGGVNARAAWNRAGTSLTITCDVRTGYENQNCVAGATAYTVGVRARNAAGESAWTNSAQVSLAAPGPVASVNVVHKGASLEVTWEAPARATHYDVTYSFADDIGWVREAWNRAGAGLTIESIDTSKSYIVGVRARNAAGKSAWVNSSSAAPPSLNVADATAAEPGEGESATLDFVVTLNRVASGEVTVRYTTGNTSDTATAGTDYTAASGKLTFQAGTGDTSKTVKVQVLTDTLDDDGETLTLALWDASGAVISDAEATGTITNDGPIPAAWLARFGRAAAADAIAAVTARLQTPRGAGSHLTVGGVRLPFGDAGSGNAGATPNLPPAADGPGRASWPSWFGDPSGDVERTMSARELLMGTSFRAVLGSGAGAQWTGWGQGASVSQFSSAGPNLSLSGETATGSMGMDFERGRLLAGFAMTHSLGEGTAHGAGRSYVMGSTVTTMLPYARFALSERISAWGLAGTGAGRLTLDLDGGVPERYGTDLTMTLAALGVRGELVAPAQGASGFALALEADAFWVRTASDAVSTPGVGNLAGARGDASRLRAVLDGSRTFALAGGRTLTPQATLGFRHDGGDAETGTGLELGAGLGYADASRGLDMALRVHGLAAHRQDGYSEWGVSGSLRLEPGGSGRGLSASLTPSWGADPVGAERLWTLPDAGALAANGDAPPSSRLDAEAGFGLAVFGGGFTGTPHVGFGLSDAAREFRMGWRLTPAGGGGFELNLDAARREAANDDAPEHRIGFGVTARW